MDLSLRLTIAPNLGQTSLYRRQILLQPASKAAQLRRRFQHALRQQSALTGDQSLYGIVLDYVVAVPFQ